MHATRNDMNAMERNEGEREGQTLVKGEREGENRWSREGSRSLQDSFSSNCGPW